MIVILRNWDLEYLYCTVLEQRNSFNCRIVNSLIAVWHFQAYRSYLLFYHINIERTTSIYFIYFIVYQSTYQKILLRSCLQYLMKIYIFVSVSGIRKDGN